MRIAFLFAGQGAEEPRMGLDVAARSTEARALIAIAGEATGVDPFRLLAEGGAALGRTAVIQPLLTAACLAVDVALAARGLRPDYVAGHSIGELAAWASGGAIPRERAIRAAAERGRLMEREAARNPGGMIALVDADEGIAEAALAVGRARGTLVLAAVNAPRERVLSGDPAALAAVAAAFPSTRLRVAGAWHSPAMAGAEAELGALLGAIDRAPLTARLVANDDGNVVEREDEVPARIAGQLTRPVRWAETLATLAAAGVTDLVTVGPGRLLRALARKNLGAQVRVHAAFDAADVDALAALAQRRASAVPPSGSAAAAAKSAMSARSPAE